MNRAIALILGFGAAPAAAEAPGLALPIACTIGETCFVQNYMDRDPGPGDVDFACGPLTYDGHAGTDFALSSLAALQAGVAVLATAPGVVIGTRDGMADAPFTGNDAPGIDGKECGNGVLIDHGNGWQSQYCHMKQGSIRPKKGESVAVGAVLGQVGLSGRTEFPHLHFSVRKDGRTIDPFRPKDDAQCASEPADALWLDQLPYIPGGLIAAGFAPGLPEFQSIKAGTAALETIALTADGLVLWAYVYGARQGDEIAFDFTGPQGLAFATTVALPKTQAQLYRATGKRRKTAPWPAGPITGSVRLVRNGVEIDSRAVVARLGD